MKFETTLVYVTSEDPKEWLPDVVAARGQLIERETETVDEESDKKTALDGASLGAFMGGLGRGLPELFEKVVYRGADARRAAWVAFAAALAAHGASPEGAAKAADTLLKFAEERFEVLRVPTQRPFDKTLERLYEPDKQQ